MTKTRVKKGGQYWFITPELEVKWGKDDRGIISTPRYECGNYFKSEQLALLAVSKIRAVLAGADVIEMPESN